MKRHIPLLALIAVLVGLALWGGGSANLRPSRGAVESYDGNAEFGLMAYQSRPTASTAAPALIAVTDSLLRGGGGATTPNLVIRNGEVALEVDSLERAVAEIHALTERLGGYVSGTATRLGRGRVRSATLTLKVPAERFDAAVAGVRPIGRVESVNISTQDVSEEYVDVDARMENARRLERRLAQILANRTGALKDVLEVEQALARVRQDIERYEGRLRYLRAHAAMSGLSVHVHEPAPLVGHEGASVLGAAAAQAWANFVSLAVVLVQALGFVLPLGALGAAGWLAVRKLGSMRGSAAADRGV